MCGILYRILLPSLEIKAYVMLILTAACWGLNVILGQFAVGEVSPMAVVMFRWLGVVLFLLIIYRKKLITHLEPFRNNGFYIIVMGGVGYTGFNALYYVAAHSTSAINIGILQGTIPIFILAGTYFVLKAKVILVQCIGISITFLGVVIVVTEGDFNVFGELALRLGDALMLLACMFYAGYALGLRNRPSSNALQFFTALSMVAFLASVPLVAIEIFLGYFQWPTMQGWLVVCLIAVFPSFFAQVLFIKGVELIGPSRAGSFANLVPIFGSVFSILILDEHFTYFHGMALVFVLGGIWISENNTRSLFGYLKKKLL